MEGFCSFKCVRSVQLFLGIMLLAACKPILQTKSIRTEISEPPTASLHVVDDSLSEGPLVDAGLLRLSRSGNLDQSLKVNMTYLGTAVANSDYKSLSSSIEIPAGLSSVEIVIEPISDGNYKGDRSLEVSISSGEDYLLGDSISALLIISDSDAEGGGGDNFEPGTITDFRVQADGWFAEIDIAGFSVGGTADYGFQDDNDPDTVDNDVTNAKMVLNVSSEGFNAAGVLGTVSRNVFGVKTIRKPFPENTMQDRSVLDERVQNGKLTVKVALSDFIYRDDRDGGVGTSGQNLRLSLPAGWYTDDGPGGSGLQSRALSNAVVKNFSTLQYPKVIGRWAWPAWERSANNYQVELLPIHRFARNARPVVAVIISANDQSGNNLSLTVNEMNKSARSGDANVVQVYAASIPMAEFDQGEVVDINFRAYPWIGDESSVLDSRTNKDGFLQPDERLGPLHVLNDRSGSYGAGYARVSMTGVDASGIVAASEAAAATANAFRTIGAAAVAIKAFHQTQFNRDSAAGGVILLEAGDHAYPGSIPAASLGITMDSWLIIRPAAGATREQARIVSATESLKASRVKIEGLNLVLSSGSIRGNPSTDVLWLHNNLINPETELPFLSWKVAYATQNRISSALEDLAANFGGIRGPFALVRGNDAEASVDTHFYAVLGNKNVNGRLFVENVVNSANHHPSHNSIMAFNTNYALLHTTSVAESSEMSGVAVIQNIFERIGPSPSGVMQVAGSGGKGAASTNLIFWHNTFVGERIQWGYSYNGNVDAPLKKLNWGSKFNIFTKQGIKTDTFTDAEGLVENHLANWALVYNVGSVGNKCLNKIFDGDFHGLYSQWGPATGFIEPGFLNDRSKDTGTGEGQGDYRLQESSMAINPVSAPNADEYRVLPFDIFGTPRTGSPDSGATEYESP